jgi:hypothetical protein
VAVAIIMTRSRSSSDAEWNGTNMLPTLGQMVTALLWRAQMTLANEDEEI